jgi:uncharacterized membrane protein YeiH
MTEAAVDLLRALDLGGTFVFGLSGGLLAIRKRMDVFGVAVLSLAAALGGGILRDVLIGATPPAAFRDATYLWIALAAGGSAFFFHRQLERIESAVRVFDAMGLALFTVTGTSKALVADLSPLPAALLGVLTAVGGGVLRDVLAGDVPLVLQREIYALAALLGAAIVVGAAMLGAYGAAAACAAAGATFLVRMLAIRYRWHAPRAPG